MLSFNFSADAAEPKRIALLPFKINAEKDMSYLQNGIFDMFTSRLTKEGEVEVITLPKQTPITPAPAGSPKVRVWKSEALSYSSMKMGSLGR